VNQFFFKSLLIWSLFSRTPREHLKWAPIREMLAACNIPLSLGKPHVLCPDTMFPTASQAAAKMLWRPSEGESFRRSAFERDGVIIFTEHVMLWLWQNYRYTLISVSELII
jgi:hypothetical protein